MKKFIKVLDVVMYNFLIAAMTLGLYLFFLGVIASVVPFWISMILSAIIAGNFVSIFPHQNIVSALYEDEIDD